VKFRLKQNTLEGRHTVSSDFNSAADYTSFSIRTFHSSLRSLTLTHSLFRLADRTGNRTKRKDAGRSVSLIAIRRADLEGGIAMEAQQRRGGGGMIPLSPSQTPRSSDKPVRDLRSADSNSNSHNKYDKDKGVNVQVLVRCR